MSRLSGQTVLAGVVSLVVGAAIIGGIVLIGPPSEQRKLRMDERRVKDLQRIASDLDGYFEAHQSLPKSLQDTTKTPVIFGITNDPQTGAAYGYQSTGAVSRTPTFQLCATFELATPEDIAVPVLPNSRYGRWPHPAGRFCYDLRVPARFDNASGLTAPGSTRE